MSALAVSILVVVYAERGTCRLCPIFYIIAVVVNSITAGGVSKGPLLGSGVYIWITVIALSRGAFWIAVSVSIYIRTEIQSPVTVVVLAVTDLRRSRIHKRVRIIAVSGCSVWTGSMSGISIPVSIIVYTGIKTVLVR
jgi:hypothetical protein